MKKDFKQASEMRYNIQPAETFAEPMVYTKQPTPETKEYGKLIASGYYNGLNYYVKNIAGMHPTAYIEIPQGHRAYNMDFYECIENYVSLNVHWGVTFQEGYLKTVDDNGDRDHKFIGWDYGHAGDFAGYYIGDKWMEDLNYKKWTTEEIIAECKDAIDQINDLSNYVMGVK